MEAPSERTRVRRAAERAEYDLSHINLILDEALICHVGIVSAEGHPVVIPTIHARGETTLYIHGSPASRLLRSMKSGDEICVTVTLVDGLVVARSAFHNSMNYRSVVVFGAPRLVEDRDEKLAALELITDRLIEGRWAESRPVLEKEIKGTLVVALPLEEASAKIRTGGPIDDEDDYDFPIWAGVIPLQLAAGDPIDDYRLIDGLEPPPSVVGYRR